MADQHETTDDIYRQIGPMAAELAALPSHELRRRLADDQSLREPGAAWRLAEDLAGMATAYEAQRSGWASVKPLLLVAAFVVELAEQIDPAGSPRMVG